MNPPLAPPELLAPAGDWECARAAVENGADAIYFGLERFNARMRADNFTEADLPELMAFLHRRGVKGYLSFNTLIFTPELAEAEACLRSCIAARVDAAIVQDVGICQLIRALSPDFPIHASTQMTVTSAAGLALAADLGCNLVVLARECSVRDIARLQAEHAETAAAQSLPPLPLEVFVHGALCVAYSGQCLTSEALGGRSANRGECAQACRLPYELVSDGQPVPLGDRRYLLSPLDLAGLPVLPELVRLGLRSLKIEGRLKSPEYVASITRIYRQAIDTAWAQPPHAAHPPPPTPAHAPQTQPVAPAVTYEMEMAFSRGLHTGWLEGINNQTLVQGRFGKKRGVYLGRVLRVTSSTVAVQLEGPLQRGDGIVFDHGQPDQPEQGGRVYTLEQRGAETTLGFGRGDLDLRRIYPGDRLWKTSDPELQKQIRQSFSGDAPRYQRPLTARIRGTVGQPLELELQDELGHTVRLASALPLAPAHTQPLTPARLAEQLGRLGGTPFRLAHVEAYLDGPLLLPVSELNRLRREAVAQLEALRAHPRPWTLRPDAPAPLYATLVPGLSADSAPSTPPFVSPAASKPPAPELCVLVRTLPQLEAALAAGALTLYAEFEDPKRYREAVARVRAARASMAPTDAAPVPLLYIAPPRITKPGEAWILNQVRSAEADGYLVRNADHLQHFAGARCVGDFSLNVANPITAAYFRRRWNLERLTASYDLNSDQLEALLRNAPPAWFEITLHQHMPMFHMEHCVFCAFLSQGTDYTNCGRPCDRHDVRLRDRVGAEHPVKADAGCRNTVYNARAQTGAEYATRFLALGVRHFRIEFLDESPAQVSETIPRYQALLAGRITGRQLWQELRLQHQLGVTRGTLDHGQRPLTVL